MQSVSPVYTQEEVQFEREIAKNQPQYETVIGLPVGLQVINPKTFEMSTIDNWAISLRFRLNEEERAAIAAGDDLVITQLVFGKSLTPMNLQLCPANTKPLFEAAEPPAESPITITEAKPENVIEFPSALAQGDGSGD